MKNFRFKNKIIGLTAKLVVVFFCLIFFANIARATETYGPSESIIVGEFIYNDDYTPTTDDCTISIYSPVGATLVNEATMSDDATGWHYYSYTTPATNGKYPTFVTCGTLVGGDLLKLDKSFIVDDPEVTDASVASAVWASGSRTLTSFGTLVSDIWSNGTRSLTTFGTLVSDIWSNATRSLTTKNIAGGGSFATEDYIDASEATVVSEIQTTQALISALNNISAADVWAYGTRSINSGTVSVDAGSVTAIWDKATSGLTTAGSVGKLIVDNLDAQVSTRGTSTLTAGDVWSSATRTLSSGGVDSIATGVWSNAGRTLTNYGNDITALDVWNVLSTSLTAVGSIGEQLALNIDGPISDVLIEVQNNATLINNLGDISAADVWAYGSRSLNSGTVSVDAGSVTAIWDKATSSLTTAGSVGKRIADNLDAQITSRGTSSLTASDVWNSATRTLSDYSTSTIANAVWASGARTLTNYGNNITAADVWNVMSSSLNTVGSIGEQLSTNVDTALSDVLTEVQANGASITALNDISASDVWAYGTRSLNADVDISSASVDEIWDIATINLATAGSIGKLLVDNVDEQISSRGTSNLTASDIWNAGTRTLTEYSNGTSETAIAAAVWANATRTLSSYGNELTAEAVWNVLASTLTTVGSIGEQVATNLDAQVSSASASENWTVKMGNVERVQAGYTYRTKLFIFDADSVPADPITSAPAITLYDANRNVVVSAVPMTSHPSTGVYEYTYSVASGAAQGLWEAVISTGVDVTKTIVTNDYFEVSGSPAQVVINHPITATSLNNISANVTISNEGLSGYEYDYEWCIVSSLANNCGGNDDAYYASAAKFINPGEDWNTNLSGSVSTAGTYYFKLKVYFGTESSSASRVFSVSGPVINNGGGGGGGGGPSLPPAPPVDNGTCNGADFNKDNNVNSIDFSILLYFWKGTPPFANPCVDINLDEKVNSVDFSIMLYQWGKKS